MVERSPFQGSGGLALKTHKEFCMSNFMNGVDWGDSASFQVDES